MRYLWNKIIRKAQNWATYIRILQVKAVYANRQEEWCRLLIIIINELEGQLF
jgi:hypothetical protein